MIYYEVRWWYFGKVSKGCVRELRNRFHWYTHSMPVYLRVTNIQAAVSGNACRSLLTRERCLFGLLCLWTLADSDLPESDDCTGFLVLTRVLTLTYPWAMPARAVVSVNAPGLWNTRELRLYPSFVSYLWVSTGYAVVSLNAPISWHTNELRLDMLLCL